MDPQSRTRRPRSPVPDPNARIRPHGPSREGLDRVRRSGWTHYAGPAGVSLICHGAVILLLALATWAASSGGEPILTEYQAKIVADPNASGPTGGYHFPGRANIDRPDSVRAAREADSIQDLASLLNEEEAFKLSPGDSGGSGLDKLTLSELARSDVLGTGTGGGLGRGGLGSGLGDRNLAGGGPVGSLWGVGEGQHAKTIVYVMDRSGSMGDTFALLQHELLRAIGSLQDDQLFNVIWFNEGPANELFRHPIAATLDNKRRAFAAIKKIVPSGQTEPINAVRRGLSYRPDVLFLLSDGAFGKDNVRIMQIIRQRNKDLATTINTILFVYDTAGDGERVLRSIAEANHGTFKHVTEQDLRR